MNITSLQFVIFVLLVFLAYYLFPGRRQHFILLAASLIFIFIIDIRAGFVFLLLSAGNYIIAARIAPDASHQKRFLFLWLGIILNTGVWAYFRWVDFFVPYLVYYLKRIGVSLDSATWMLIFPVGLSFYIVQAMAYLVDVYKGRVKSSEDFSVFCLYMLYFPRLVSGPIERPHLLIPQFQVRHSLKSQNFTRSFYLILEGLVRKIAFADVLSLLLPVDIFSNPASFMPAELFFWLVVYAFLLYNDFAGYISIIRGVSLLFGIKLSENFRQPYFSRSFTEFWQRWHITLSDWLRDYIFSPLTRSLLRKKKALFRYFAIILPPMITMLVSGLWHGAGWNMLFWGAIHGFYLIGERLLSQVSKVQPVQLRQRSYQVVSMIVVFLLTTLAWIPFRMQLPEAKIYFTSLLAMPNWMNFHSRATIWNLMTAISLLIIMLTVLIDIYQYRRGFSYFLKKSTIQKALLINAALLLIIIGFAIQTDVPPPFIYQGF